MLINGQFYLVGVLELISDGHVDRIYTDSVK
jgi:hypothetical protein